MVIKPLVLYSSLLNQRIQKHLENNNLLAEEQNGCRVNRSCEDHIFSLDSVINIKKKQNESVYVAFIDFSKAFDLVNREQLLLQVLKNNTCINGNVYWAIKAIYKFTESRVNINNFQTDLFMVTNGVRQGDPLSPTLFSIYINDLINTVKDTGVGIQIEDLLLNILNIYIENAPEWKSVRMSLKKSSLHQRLRNPLLNKMESL